MNDHAEYWGTLPLACFAKREIRGYGTTKYWVKKIAASVYNCLGLANNQESLQKELKS